MKLRYGMIGGGAGAFIGEVHRTVIAVNGDSLLTAGSFSSTAEKNLASGRALNLPDERVYGSYEEMARVEASRDDGIDYVVIVTPNHLHYPVARAFLERGIHVVCEKPLTHTSDEARELKRLAVEKGCLFMVTYTYTGHAMAREARKLVENGALGEITMVMAEYASGFLVDPVEKEGNKQAVWRTNPAQSGISNTVGDIGTHVENLVSFVTGLRIRKLIANLDYVGEGRILDDAAEILIKYDNGASGLYWVSHVATGCENGLRIRVFGTEGSLEFDQENPNYLTLAKKGEPPQRLSRAAGYGAAAEISRLPAGHPEGYFVAFANIYRLFTAALAERLNGQPVEEQSAGYPTIDDGIDGVVFIEKCVESMRSGNTWVTM